MDRRFGATWVALLRAVADADAEKLLRTAPSPVKAGPGDYGSYCCT